MHPNILLISNKAKRVDWMGQYPQGATIRFNTNISEEMHSSDEKGLNGN
jgi:hypothetical protein